MKDLVKEIEVDDIPIIANRIKLLFKEEKDKVMYVFIYGKHAKQSFAEMSGDKCIGVKWVGYFAPKLIAFFLSNIIAGYGGLIKINSTEKLEVYLKRFSHLSMCSLYIFDIIYESELIEYIKKDGWKSNPGLIVQKDLSFYTISIDGDNSKSSSGYLQIINYGIECRAN